MPALAAFPVPYRHRFATVSIPWSTDLLDTARTVSNDERPGDDADRRRRPDNPST
jgi:hypothetical protein